MQLWLLMMTTKVDEPESEDEIAGKLEQLQTLITDRFSSTNRQTGVWRHVLVNRQMSFLEQTDRVSSKHTDRFSSKHTDRFSSTQKKVKTFSSSGEKSSTQKKVKVIFLGTHLQPIHLKQLHKNSYHGQETLYCRHLKSQLDTAPWYFKWMDWVWDRYLWVGWGTEHLTSANNTKLWLTIRFEEPIGEDILSETNLKRWVDDKFFGSFWLWLPENVAELSDFDSRFLRSSKWDPSAACNVFLASLQLVGEFQQ